MTMLSLERSRSSARIGIDDAVAHARHVGQTALYSRVERLPFAPDAIAFLSASSAALGSGALWEQPAARLAFVGAGLAWEIRATGSGRFGQISTAMRDLRSRLVRDDAAVFLHTGGFAFSELGDGSHLWERLPERSACGSPGAHTERRQRHATRGSRSRSGRDRRRAMSRSRSRSVPTRTGLIQSPLSVMHTGPVSALNRSRVEDPGSHRLPPLLLIRQGTLDKVVLAREERLLAESAFSPFRPALRAGSIRRQLSSPCNRIVRGSSAPAPSVWSASAKTASTSRAWPVPSAWGAMRTSGANWLTGCSPARRTVRSTRSSSARR